MTAKKAKESAQGSVGIGIGRGVLLRIPRADLVAIVGPIRAQVCCRFTECLSIYLLTDLVQALKRLVKCFRDGIWDCLLKNSVMRLGSSALKNEVASCVEARYYKDGVAVWSKGVPGSGKVDRGYLF